MRLYLNVTVRRVQQYLARSTEEALQSRRAASAQLIEATDSGRVAEAVRAHLPAVEVNDEAVATDETAHLRLPDDTNAEQAARHALVAVRQALPAAQLHAVTGRGENYYDAYRTHLGPKLASGAGIVSPPPAADVLPALRCEICGDDLATEPVRLVDEPRARAACTDCAQRFRRGPAAVGQADPHGPQHRLVARLGGTDETGAPARDFNELAAQGGGNANHLATIYADANGLGAAFATLLDGADPSDRGSAARNLSGVVKDAVDAALDAAAAPLRRPGGVFPVAAHLVGGDDVLVSVPADHAFAFTRTLLETFTATVDGGLDALGAAARRPDPPLTMSAAVVIAHRSYPFLRCADLADEQLADAKRHGGGSTAMVAWLLVTQEGLQPPAGRSAWPLQALTDHDGDLAGLAGLPQHARKRLARALAHPTEAIAGAYARRALRRAGDPGEASRVLDVRGVQGLRDALTLADWWPDEAAPQQPQPATGGHRR